MTILVNARFLTQKITGVQRFASEICLELNKISHDIIFLTPPIEQNEDLVAKLNLKIIGKKKGHYWEQVELPLYIKKNYPNCILLNLCNTAPLFYNKNIITVHDLAFEQKEKWFSNSFTLFYKFLIPKICKKSIHIFTVSKFSKSEIERYYNITESKITVLGNYINESFYGNGLEKSKNINENRVILSVSSIDPRKNIQLLINAFSKINDENISLIFVGGNSKNFAKENRLNNGFHKNVVFTGYISDNDLIKYYQNASVFVYPSLYEGFGIPPLEALASGCKILISDIPVFKEVFKNEANYFKNNSVDDLYEKLMSSDLKNGEINNLQLKNWESLAKTLLEIVKNISLSK